MIIYNEMMTCDGLACLNIQTLPASYDLTVASKEYMIRYKKRAELEE